MLRQDLEDDDGILKKIYICAARVVLVRSELYARIVSSSLLFFFILISIRKYKDSWVDMLKFADVLYNSNVNTDFLVTKSEIKNKFRKLVYDCGCRLKKKKNSKMTSPHEKY